MRRTRHKHVDEKNNDLQVLLNLLNSIPDRDMPHSDRPTMSLWELKRRKDDGGYDEALGFVVAAPTPEEARAICSEHAGDEVGIKGIIGGRPDFWENPKFSICKHIGTSNEKEARLILRDIRNG